MNPLDNNRFCLLYERSIRPLGPMFPDEQVFLSCSFCCRFTGLKTEEPRGVFSTKRTQGTTWTRSGLPFSGRVHIAKMGNSERDLKHIADTGSWRDSHCRDGKLPGFTLQRWGTRRVHIEARIVHGAMEIRRANPPPPHHAVLNAVVMFSLQSARRRES